MTPAVMISRASFYFDYSRRMYLHPQWHPHLFIVVLPRCEIIAQGDPVAQLLAQGVQELVGVAAARRAGESEQLLTPV